MAQDQWRRSIRQLKEYIPGKAIEEVKRELGLDKIIRLASNENPFGPSPKAVQAMQAAVADSQLYPESTGREVREKLANLYQLALDQLLIANGGDNVISLIGTAYINPGDEVIYCTPTFPAYRTTTLLMEGIPVEVPMTQDYTYNLEGILAAITENTKLIFVCNPNNPTGTIVENADFEAFLQQLPPHVIVVLDEAYVEFIAREGYRNGIDFLKDGYPVICIRTFSKLYGLAGTRIGYAVGSKEHLKPICAVREPFAANRIAQAGALAALDDTEYKSKSIRENRFEAVKLIKELRGLGFDVNDTHANFLFVDVKENVSKVSEVLLHDGIIIRPCTAWGLKTHARITIGTSEQNERLLQSLRKISAKLAKS
ncbi:histidinol-phosphate transaminase [Neobacillus sp. YIM B02564]|uniref:Histidinol-phosphate aminotransferase n=1 Tax=Neobacillus paridis TaxID=2803862 RepID=A0ABS1TSN8_9BACI|nr:histidinol-phosphate transaminase [Neobacillus paridis]MBL4954337.1 histidinol-phosphate transaminase [Neobacillus paridis]